MERKISIKEHIASILRKMFFLALGPFVAAFALEVFLVPNNIIDGGIVGISIITSYLTKINLGLFGSKNEEDDTDSNKNLILFCIGGLSNFEIASIEQGLSVGQWGLNLILGANKIYNYKEFFDEIYHYLNGNNEIKTIKEAIPKEIVNKKKKDYEDRMKGGKNENQEQKVDIHKIENKKNSGGKYSKEKLKNLESNLSDDSNDMK